MSFANFNTYQNQVLLYGGATGGGCLVGPQGFQGVQGVQGFIGNLGNQGVQGDIGPLGNQGWQGFQGIQGQFGIQGPLGLQGNQGDAGLQGSTNLYYSGALTNIISGGTGIVYSTTLNGAVGDCFILHLGVRKNSPGFPASTLSVSLKVSGSTIYDENINDNGDSTAGAVFICIFSNTEAYAYELNRNIAPNATIISAVGGNISVETSYSVSGTITDFDFLNLSIEKLVK
jgi:hypothetical protein